MGDWHTAGGAEIDSPYSFTLTWAAAGGNDNALANASRHTVIVGSDGTSTGYNGGVTKEGMSATSGFTTILVLYRGIVYTACSSTMTVGDGEIMDGVEGNTVTVSHVGALKWAKVNASIGFNDDSTGTAIGQTITVRGRSTTTANTGSSSTGDTSSVGGSYTVTGTYDGVGVTTASIDNTALGVAAIEHASLCQGEVLLFGGGRVTSNNVVVDVSDADYEAIVKLNATVATTAPAFKTTLYDHDVPVEAGDTITAAVSVTGIIVPWTGGTALSTNGNTGGNNAKAAAIDWHGSFNKIITNVATPDDVSGTKLLFEFGTSTTSDPATAYAKRRRALVEGNRTFLNGATRLGARDEIQVKGTAHDWPTDSSRPITRRDRRGQNSIVTGERRAAVTGVGRRSSTGLRVSELVPSGAGYDERFSAGEYGVVQGSVFAHQ